MIGIPAICSKCGFKFVPKSKGPDHIVSELVDHMRDETTCPRCGSKAPFEKGVHTVFGDQIAIISGPINQPMIDKLHRFGLDEFIVAEILRTVGEAKEKSSDAESLVKEVERLSPEIGRLIRPLAKYKTPAFIIAVVVLIINHIQLNVNLDLNQIFSRAIQQVELQAAEPKTKEATAKASEDHRSKKLDHRKHRRHLERKARKIQRHHSKPKKVR